MKNRLYSLFLFIGLNWVRIKKIRPCSLCSTEGYNFGISPMSKVILKFIKISEVMLKKKIN